MSSAYTRLTDRFQRLSRFSHLSAIAGWDMMTMMSPAGSQARGEALAELGVLQHQILTSPATADDLAQAKQESLNEIEQANLAEMTRAWQQAVILPAELVQAKSIAGARCEHAWRSQRPANDWSGFAENLKQVVKLSRQEAELRAQDGGISRYDALLALYEPGMTSQQLDTIFTDIKSWLPALLQQVIARQRRQTLVPPQGPFAVDKQRQLGLSIMSMLGFDFNAGRLDVSAHPFCGGVPQDVRITTRYDTHNFLSALMGVIHETGHARYEQNLPKQWQGQPVALARSTAIHESQSLFFEMQIGRSPAFLTRILPQIIHHLGYQQAFSADNLIALAQRVQPGLIRVDADEVSYPIHIIVRYEIERALIEGEIEVEDIPVLWQEKMQQLAGIDTTGNYRDGCMQDIHWTDGAFGYFPTYTLGAMYAAQLFQALSTAQPALQQQIASGEMQQVFNWLQHNVWQYGSRLSSRELIVRASGEDLNPHWFRQHLTQRYLPD
ncbi:carboxypeptidase M32 [Erwinia sp. OLTSP20]|uniref:carboxypeptidase M32 n=1 Tax=unclassified Erwinia TaxID=2622719 RepID=UPI000C177A77|nr:MULTISPECIES: carboxypeptidase M32 [unclassified Erwinia]PIJ48588.1 carboxypeptidase M32 [Erwinia sp. OAMSP11]PIJ68773.1 carboxypeptidase M32 [Erwinia sp. OLSSP12]PIJ79337.1 carboxypeptidase M32 [Erwinia sp. OLCASP19]PIJ79520.1 carboxypeptidase M32 [Erwinia sp. OLMTSP26]PIJ81721.1 carboxypeptidase M32 [Erwinia sp. OLMDSP33]